MALGTIPPWLNVRPTDFVTAAQEGATTGLRAAEQGASVGVRAAEMGQQATIESARLRQQSELETQRLAQQAALEQQRLAMEGARLQQQANIAQMELEAKREQTAQQAARLAQQHEMEYAYKQASLGLQSARVLNAKEALDQKSAAAAESYADTQGLADFYARGGDIATGLSMFPKAQPTIANTLFRAAGEAKDYGDIQTREYPWGTAIWRQGSPGVHIMQKKAGTDEKILFKELDRVNRELATTSDEGKRSELLREAEATKTALREISAAGTTTGTTGAGASSAGWQLPDWMTGRNVMPAPLGTSVSDIVSPSDVAATATGTNAPAPVATTNVPPAATEPATPAPPAAPAAPAFKARTQAEAKQVLDQAWDKYLKAPSKVQDIRSQLKSMIPQLTDEDLDKFGFK